MPRKKIFFIWLFGSVLLMLITASISMVIWNFFYQAEGNITREPINHVFGMMFLVPVGWLLSFMTPFGWASILFLCISLWKKSPYILIGSAIATLLSGAWWPTIYMTMLDR